MRYILLGLLMMFTIPAFAEDLAMPPVEYAAPPQPGQELQTWNTCLDNQLKARLADCTVESSPNINDDDFAACQTEEDYLAASYNEEERAITMAANREDARMRAGSSDCDEPPSVPPVETTPATPAPETKSE